MHPKDLIEDVNTGCNILRKFILTSTILYCCFSGFTQWNYVGQAGISNDWTVENDIQTDTSGSPAIVFFENQSEYKASCLRFDGIHWSQVGEETFGNFSIESILDFEIDDKNNYYILYLDADFSTSCIRYNGTTWEFVGSQYISIEYSPYTSLAIDTAGTAYVAFQSQSGFSIVKENGESWMPVSLNGLPGVDRYFDLLFDKENVAFLGYCGMNGMVPNCAKLVNGNWEPVGSAVSFTLFASETYLQITEDRQLYMGFLEPDMGFHKFNTLTDGWEKIETASLGENYMGIWDIISDSSSNIYISVLSDRARCYKYDGSAWSQLGNSGISESEASYIRMAVNKHDELYATYNDYTESKAVVKKYDHTSNIDHILQDLSFKIYPNPALDHFYIESEGQKFTVLISDVNGQLVYEHNMGTDRIEIDTHAFDRGVYIVRIRTAKGTYHNRKIIVL